MKKSVIRLCALALCFLFTNSLTFATRQREQRTDDLLRALNLREGQVVVDIGAGDGSLTRRFAAAVGATGKAIGIEVDPEKVREMTADARRRGLTNFEARLVPADDPQLAHGSVDVIFLRDTYHHIENRIAYFAKIKSALKAGGRLVIVDFPKKQSHYECGIAKDKVRAELLEAGYRFVKDFDVLQSRQYVLEFVPIAKMGATLEDF